MNRSLAVGVVAVTLLAVAVGAAFVVTDPLGGDGVQEMETFEDSESFASYVQRGSTDDFAAGPRAETADVETTTASADAGGVDGGSASEESSESGGPSRVGTTNVQVGGVDEPDLVKTDGEHFYYAVPHSSPLPEPTSTVEKRARGTTHVVDASEPADPALVGDINESGRQLLVGDTLVVFTREGLVGYDVSTPAEPTREWERERNGTLVAARATGGQVYLVVEVPVAQSPECPVEPMDGASVACGDIYHPRESVPVDATYVAISLDAGSGAVTDRVGFVGTRSHTAVHVTGDALYVTYTEPFDRGEAYTEALLASGDVPDHVKERLREIRSYDLSSRAQVYEVGATVENWLRTLNESERRRVSETLSTDLENYVSNHSRNFTTTGIVRVSIDGGLAVEAHGTVPGRPLDQFSLDEHDGHLRVATTVPGAGRDSENDLYTLDSETLDRVGSVQGMGEDQQIFAVRYVGDTAYLVTFRRVDPFHVVDLSDPENPVEQGVLELPGFSSYLHPVDDDTVLGIGEEDGRVKAVLFDVSDPTDPTIADSKVFDRGRSRVSATHHAFTIDRRHGVFFLPAGGEGLVVDYANESLAVETTVETGGAVRARYVDDYLYVFGQREVAVLDETTWERTATLALADQSDG
ncbi:MAG: beta-propeller domain-containing protein [Haloarculaceae archaeon]